MMKESPKKTIVVPCFVHGTLEEPVNESSSALVMKISPDTKPSASSSPSIVMMKGIQESQTMAVPSYVHKILQEPIDESSSAFVMKISPDAKPILKKAPVIPSVTKKKSLLAIFHEERREKTRTSKEAGTGTSKEAGTSELVGGSRGNPDWFSKYEKPIKSDEQVAKELFLNVQKAEKCKKVWKCCRSSTSSTSVVVSCLFKSGADDVCSYLRSKGVDTAILHKSLNNLQQENARKQFNEGRVLVLVATHDMLLRTTVRRSFDLINFDLPLYFTDYQKLVSISQTTKTFINEESSGIALLELVEAYPSVPEFVRKFAEGKK